MADERFTNDADVARQDTENKPVAGSTTIPAPTSASSIVHKATVGEASSATDEKTGLIDPQRQ